MTTMSPAVMDRKIQKLSRFHLRVVLDFMGIPIADQPNSIKQLRMFGKKLAEKMPDDFIKYYSIVVDHKLPEGGDFSKSEIERSQDQARMLKIIEQSTEKSADFLRETAQRYEVDFRDGINKQQQELITRVIEEARKTKETFAQAAHEAILEASKKFVTHQIKINKLPAKKVKGTPPKQFTKLIQLASARKNILMVGPSGCGKTHVAAMLADQLGLEFSAQSCSVGVSESNFVGWLLPTGANGRFNHMASEFIRLYENGGVFLFDELDNADPNVLVFMNMALANGEFYLPQRFENPKVTKHKDFIAVAAANTFGGGADILYSSRNALDAATLDRFRIGTVFMDYDDGVEEALIQNSELLAWGRRMRAAIKNRSLHKLMSTRALIDAQDMMASCGWTLKDCEESYFADWTREEIAMIGGSQTGVES